MAKANRQTEKITQMNKNFDQMLGILEDMAASSEEIMPLFAASLELSRKIILTYKKAFNAGTKFTR